MKGIFVVLDGLGDLPNKQLNQMTPLEAAETPNLNFLANRSDLGLMYPLKPGQTPESSDSILSIFGNEVSPNVRGQLEAAGTDIKVVRGDLVLRTNFATIDSLSGRNIIDRRVGRTLTTSEAEALAKSINKIEIPRKFVLKPTVQHRGVLVFKGGFSDNITGNDVHYSNGGDKIVLSKPLDDDENSQYSANILNEFLEKVYETLKDHPVNELRKRKGLMPANFLLVRGGGINPPKLKFYNKWASVAYMPLEIGFSKISGMNVFSSKYPKMKNYDVYENLYSGLKNACKLAVSSIKKSQKKNDYIYIHIKETDIPGHDNKPFEKKIMIEYLDKHLFSFIQKFATKNKIKVLITGDHSTPCKLKSHSADPVPVLFYPADGRAPEQKDFSEKGAKNGSLGVILGADLLEKVGFLR